jgi:hypothetical protein
MGDHDGVARAEEQRIARMLANFLITADRSADIPESADVYGWLCGSWDLTVLRYRGLDVSVRHLTGEVHAARALEGRAVQDVWIMPRVADRKNPPDRGMNMYGTTLRSWDPATGVWRIAWTNPVSGHYELQSGNWSGRDIVQTGERADRTKTRWSFTEITQSSFHWLGEALYPNQSEWAVEGEFRAKRRT